MLIKIGIAKLQLSLPHIYAILSHLRQHSAKIRKNYGKYWIIIKNVTDCQNIIDK